MQIDRQARERKRGIERKRHEDINKARQRKRHSEKRRKSVFVCGVCVREGE